MIEIFFKRVYSGEELLALKARAALRRGVSHRRKPKMEFSHWWFYCRKPAFTSGLGKMQSGVMENGVGKYRVGNHRNKTGMD